MFELKNFYVKQGDKFLLENVNFQFRSPNKYRVICGNDEQKDAFIGGLLGYPNYLTFGHIIWKSKWKLEIKDTACRMTDKFFLCTDKIPNLDFLSVQDYISGLGVGLSNYNKQKIAFYVKHYDLPSSFLNKKITEDLSNEEKQKLQLIELRFLKSEFVLVDLKKPIANFFKYLDASPKSFSVIMVISMPGTKLKIKKL